MVITKHGYQRITQRTKMPPEEVLSMVNEGSAVLLGNKKGRNFFLIFSSPDDDLKIVVTSAIDGALITVLEKDHITGQGIMRPTKRLNSQARQLFQEYFFRKVREGVPVMVHKPSR